MKTQPTSIQVAIGDEFLLAFSRLSKAAQRRTRAFMEKFRSHPRSPGLNYETIKGARDPNLRSLRVDDDHRTIVLKPEKGNTYILLWVDKHDEAYKWASGRVCAIHPSTGAIQILESVETEQRPPDEQPARPAVSPEQEKPGLFDPYTKAELLDLGVPESVIDEVRTVKNNRNLDALEKLLPADAFEALYFLAISGSIEEVKRELEIDAPEEVDTEDYGAALARDSSSGKFVVITDQEDMEKVLAYPLERWRTFLHPSQKRIVQMHARGPVRVLGGAGTGKTVVAIHRAKWIAENLCTKNEKVLLTTFTKNLAADIEANLRKICPLDTLRKIEVKNLDAWAGQLLSRSAARTRRVDFRRGILDDLWKRALAEAPTGCPLSDEELRAEWDYVVQAQSIRHESAYIRAPRIGMGKPLNRAKRKEIWPVFEEYLALMKERGVCEPIDAIRTAREWIAEQGLVLNYRTVIVDEAQDFSAEAFRLVNTIVPEIRAKEGNQLFIVGDAHQRLYGHKVVLSHCGIDIRGRGKRLRINYRTSEETKRWATSILEGTPIDDLDGGLDSQKGYRSLFHGEEPVIVEGANGAEQIDHIEKHVRGLINEKADSASICLVARNHRLIDSVKDAMEKRKFECLKIAREESDDTSVPGLRFATMHRVKGLEFDHMILAHMEASVWNDGGEIKNDDKCLIHVAATRARKSVLAVSAGPILNILKKLKTSY